MDPRQSSQPEQLPHEHPTPPADTPGKKLSESVFFMESLLPNAILIISIINIPILLFGIIASGIGDSIDYTFTYTLSAFFVACLVLSGVSLTWILLRFDIRRNSPHVTVATRTRKRYLAWGITCLVAPSVLLGFSMLLLVLIPVHSWPKNHFSIFFTILSITAINGLFSIFPGIVAGVILLMKRRRI